MREKDLIETEQRTDCESSCFPRQRTPWGIRDFLIVLFLVFLMSFAFTTLCGWALERLPLFRQWMDSREAILILVAGYIQSFFFIGLVLFFVVVKYRSPFAAVGFRIPPLKEVFCTGILGGLVVLFIVVFLMLLIISLVHRTPPPQPLAELLMESSRDREFLLLSFLLVGILAPLGEEVYFRGFVYPAIRWRLGMLPALFISSAFFGALHFDPFRFLPLTAGGVALALMCERTGSLLPSIFAHGAWNILTLLLLMSGKLF